MKLGWTVSDIAHAFGVVGRTLQRWLKCYGCGSVSRMLRRPGSSRSRTLEEMGEVDLRAIVLQPGSVFGDEMDLETVGLLQSVVRERDCPHC